MKLGKRRRPGKADLRLRCQARFGGESPAICGMDRAVSTRNRTTPRLPLVDNLRILEGRCPNLLAEAGLYRFRGRPPRRNAGGRPQPRPGGAPLSGVAAGRTENGDVEKRRAAGDGRRRDAGRLAAGSHKRPRLCRDAHAERGKGACLRQAVQTSITEFPRFRRRRVSPERASPLPHCR